MVSADRWNGMAVRFVDDLVTARMWPSKLDKD
jgi:hypothetical protein